MPYPKSFDPYLRYAISTNFRNFEFFDENKKFKLFFLVEFNEGGQGKAFADAMNGLNSSFEVELGPVDQAEKNTRYATVRSNKAAVLESNAVSIWETYVSRVELSLPLKTLAAASDTLAERSPKGDEFLAPILIGVIDDGCPFAAAQFLSGASGTRVWAIWDQNQHKEPVPIKDSNGHPCLFGQTLSDFNYGLEFQRDSIPAVGGSPKQMGLNEWIQSHATPTGSIDEDGCYADAGFSTLRFRASHGAHVTDVLAGRFPTSSRISQDRLDPPTWKAGTDPASVADVVFVQFPENCIRDSTGVWLKAYVVDGIRYILSCADKKNIDTVIVNISYGPTTGPHNGTAVLEEALTALVEEFDGTTNTPKLEIVLAAGNSYLTEGHVHFIGEKEQPVSLEWTWRLPPDNTALCFAEVWMNNADACDVTVTLTSPSGVTFASTTATAPAGVDGPLGWGSDDTMWRLQVEPTVAGPGVVAEHGDYTIKVAGVRQHAEVHAYVARTDPNMDVFTGAKLSYFVDPNWERTRSAEASCTYVDGEFDKTASLVYRYGTLNGIATARDQSVQVAGGYMLANRRKSPYSSAGPARNGPLTLRKGPDYLMFCDESYALEGVPAGGNRSGAVFRLIGTSAAAPQLARWIADGWDEQHPPPTDIPNSTDEVGIEQRGGGNVPPPNPG
jgi:hypothetical protein